MRYIVLLCLPWALPAALVYPPLPYPGPAGSSGARTVQTLNYPTLDNPTLNNPALNYPTLNNPTRNNPTLENPALNYPTLNYPTLTYRPLDKEKDTNYETTEYPYVVETHLYTLEETTEESTAIEDTTNWLTEDTTNSVKVVSNNVEDASDSAEVTTVGMSKKNNEMIEETNEAMVEGTAMVIMENTTMNLPLVEVATKAMMKGTIQAMVERTTEAMNMGITEAMTEGVLELELEPELELELELELEAMNEGITEAMTEGVLELEAMKEGITEAMNEGITEAMTEGVLELEAMNEGITEAMNANLMEEGKADTTEMDNATNVKLDTDPASCAEVMTNNGLNISTFSHGAAGGIHSLHLEEIREFFEPEAPFINKIPVVNDDLSSEQLILFDAPLAGYDNDFKTMALKVMAHFMLNPHLGPQNMNTLEKVSHQYLMQEVYAAAAPIYQRIKETPPTDPKLCPCVKDITGNGILTELVNIVHQRKRSGSIRYPGSNDKTVNTKTGSDEALSTAEQEYLADSSQENAMRLLELRPWTPNTLTGPEQWVSFEAMLTTLMLNQEELTDFATFMFCKLNAAE